jgi:hypothetical protein
VLYLCFPNRATVVENRDFWYMDDGPLSRLLCEDVRENDDNQPDIMNPCCACEEAKYEVIDLSLFPAYSISVSNVN